MVFVLDNYDSFTYNLVQYMGELGAEMVIRRNDELTPAEVEALGPERILISPGPCTPQDAGISIELIRHFATASRRVPILGVCLGPLGLPFAVAAWVMGKNDLEKIANNVRKKSRAFTRQCLTLNFQYRSQNRSNLQSAIGSKPVNISFASGSVFSGTQSQIAKKLFHIARTLGFLCAASIASCHRGV